MKISSTSDCTVSRNTVAEVGVKIGTPEVDEKVTEHSKEYGCELKVAHYSDLDVAHVREHIPDPLKACFAAVKFDPADNAAFVEEVRGTETNEVPSGLRNNGCTEDSCAGVETTKGKKAVEGARPSAAFVS